MSHYLVQPVVFIGFLEQQADYLQDMDAPLASQLLMATESLLTVLQRHLSYDKLTQFNIPIPFVGPYLSEFVRFSANSGLFPVCFRFASASFLLPPA
jgi:hypothetical protein